MNSTVDYLSQGSEPEDPRVIQALKEYLASCEAGVHPCREDFMARHADVAAELAEYLDSLEFIQSAAPCLRPAYGAGMPANGDLTQVVPLGDYRILREVGRGGMGVVYEAIQMSLGRRVALKVLPFASALDARHLQRFKHEAQAAAHLHHTHIVPVYAVGSERGVHYYAMQFIDGQTLAEVILELQQQQAVDATAPDAAVSARSPSPAGGDPSGPDTPSPAASPALSTQVSVRGILRSAVTREFFRTVAQLGVQAGEALEHAHEQGVVHRDIKPGNLLLDHKSHLWITDFGLARCQSEANLTRTGDFLGTLRYMSPEQALGKRGAVDHRTDVYSLGVTLYELLTLQPAVPGSDREEVLRQLAHEEPRPLRRINPAIPTELETIVLKAMAKNPVERYATAQDLADDLRRFLEDKPIRAKRPTVAQRTAKWARRHRLVVMSTAVVFLLIVVGLNVSTVLIAGAWQRESQQRVQAEASYHKAEEQRRLARRAVDDIYMQFAERWLKDQPELDAVQEQFLQEFLQKALVYYEEFARDPDTNAEVRFDTARAHARIGDIHATLGRSAQATTAYDQALPLLDRLVLEFAEASRYRVELARVLNDLGQLLVRCDRVGPAEAALQRALTIRQHLVEMTPALPEHRRDLAGSYHNLGTLFHQTSRFDLAQTMFQKALDLSQELVSELPREPLHRRQLANHLGGLASLLHRQGQYSESERLRRLELTHRGHLVADPSAQPADRSELGETRRFLGQVLRHLRRWHEVELALREAQQTQRRLVETFPRIPLYRERLANTASDFAVLLMERDRWGEAEQVLRESLPLRQKLAEDFPTTPRYQSQIATTMHNLAYVLKTRNEVMEARRQSGEMPREGGDALKTQSELTEALELVQQAYVRQKRALGANPAHPKYQEFLHIHYWMLTNIYLQLGRHAEAAEAAIELPRLIPDRWEEFCAAASCLGQCATLAKKDTNLQPNRRQELALDYTRRQEEVLREGLRRYPDNSTLWKQWNRLSRVLPNLRPLGENSAF